MSHAVAHAHEPATCPNCEHDLPGEYCGHCGQRRLHEPEPTIPHLLHEIWHELVHVDSKIFRTLRLLLTKPGALTLEYLQGRRTCSIGPLRLYLIATGLYFLFAPYHLFSASGFLESEMGPAIAKVVPKAAEYGKTFTAAQLNLEYQKLYTVALALSVLASALVLWALLRHRSYASHLIFSAHYLAVVMFSSTVIGLAARALGLPMQVSFAAILWTESYRLLALRRSYGLPWKGAIGRWAVLFVCGFFVDYILTTGALILALKRV